MASQKQMRRCFERESQIDADYARSLLEYRDGELLWSVNRAGSAKKGTAVRGNRGGYLSVKINGILYLAHRVVWLIVYGEWPNGQLDHIDGNTMNNKVENLRIASQAANSMNRKLRVDSKTGVTGVSRREDRYRVKIGKRHVGFFSSLVRAKEARRVAERQHFGMYARGA